MGNDNEDQYESGVGVADRTETPKMYKVVLLNDDFTPMDFVIFVLNRFFNKSEEAATQIMLAVHHQGRGIAGVYSKEVAETKSAQVNALAKTNKYPFKTIIESE